MATAPYGVRLLVGAVTFAVEETRKLPQTILTYPMTLASQAAHVVMRWQQSLAELAIKGDSTLEMLFPPKDEQPEWATFDEDLDAADELSKAGVDGKFDDADPDYQGEGRFALYSFGADTDNPVDGSTETNVTPGGGATAPEVATELDYETLTLAQLRARLRSLSVDDLEALLEYEEATKARAPFQTLLANRITRATAK
ncbi:MAG TPA: lipid droplet-associated protein [Mycobacterium sp.]|nr:lipid droplet-associated protein [Mycobacterium sp.]